MNILNRTTIITVLALLVGGVAGAYLGYHAMFDYASDQSMLAIATSAQLEVSALRGLRENDRDGAVKLLEAHLDSSIAVLRNQESYSNLTNEAVHRAIELTKNYRAQHPKKNSVDDKAVNEKNDLSFPKP